MLLFILYGAHCKSVRLCHFKSLPARPVHGYGCGRRQYVILCEELAVTRGLDIGHLYIYKLSGLQKVTGSASAAALSI